MSLSGLVWAWLYGMFAATMLFCVVMGALRACYDLKEWNRRRLQAKQERGSECSN